MSATSVNTGAATDDSQTAAPEGHNEAMTQAYDDAQAAAAGNDTSTAESHQEGGGEKILGKFDSQDDLIEAYRNLESKLSKGAEGEGDGKPGDGTAETSDGVEGGDETAEKAVEKAEGVDMDSLSKEYAANGDLTAESYEALEKAGIPRETVQSYIEGQEVKAEQYRAKALEVVGGEEEFTKMSEWASTNLSQDQVDRYNAAIDSGDSNRMQQAVKALAFEYGQARPQEPNLHGGGNSNASGDRFESVAQLTEAMSDPKYSSDPAFRKEVEQKLSRSNVM